MDDRPGALYLGEQIDPSSHERTGEVVHLKSDHLTQGPVVEEFEEAFADKVGKKYAVAFNSGTSALIAAFGVSALLGSFIIDTLWLARVAHDTPGGSETC